VGETRRPFGLQAQLQGRVRSGAVRHLLTFGASHAERHNSYGDYVYDYAGYSNIYTPRVTAPAPGSPVTGPVTERFRDRERSLYVQDIVTLTPQLALHAGLRYVKVDSAQQPESDLPWVHDQAAFTLPNVALVYSLTKNWNTYASLAHGLQSGGVAPIETRNPNTDLGPNRSKQTELGVKGNAGAGVSVAAAVFEITTGLEYTNANNTFVRNGQANHRGLELSAQRAASDFSYGASLMALRARQQDTGEAGLDGKRVTNVPALKTTVWGEYALAAVPGLKLNGQWQYAGKKTFDPANTIDVPGYHVFGIGAAYGLRLGATTVTLRARVDNLFNKFYWRDVTQDLGGYLLPGAPRTARLSAQFDF
jgi:iron complex outermembrane receptor protein